MKQLISIILFFSIPSKLFSENSTTIAEEMNIEFPDSFFIPPDAKTIRTPNIRVLFENSFWYIHRDSQRPLIKRRTIPLIEEDLYERISEQIKKNNDIMAMYQEAYKNVPNAGNLIDKHIHSVIENRILPDIIPQLRPGIKYDGRAWQVHTEALTLRAFALVLMTHELQEKIKKISQTQLQAETDFLVESLDFCTDHISRELDANTTDQFIFCGAALKFYVKVQGGVLIVKYRAAHLLASVKSDNSPVFPDAVERTSLYQQARKTFRACMLMNYIEIKPNIRIFGTDQDIKSCATRALLDLDNMVIRRRNN